MIALALLTAAPVQDHSASDTVFACQFFRTDQEASDGTVHSVDIRVVRRADSTWTIQRQNESAVNATSFPAEFGSIGRSTGLRWLDANGKTKTAYISFSDMKLPGSKEYFWMNFDKPSLWKAPGYGCESDGLQGTGAGA